VDAEQLRQDFATASFSSTPVTFAYLDVSEPGSEPRVRVWFSGLPNATDTATANAIIAAHTALGPKPILVPPIGVFEVPHDRVRGRIIVAQGGAADYNTISAAIAAAIEFGASPISWYNIEVYPGVYIEPPMTVPMGVYISARSGVVVMAATPTASLFTLTGGVVTDITAGGVTGPAEAVFKTTTPGVLNGLLGCTVINCTHGFLASGAGVELALLNATATVDLSGVGISGALIKADNGARVLCTAVLAAVPAALLPFYTGNPIEKVFWADNGALIGLTTGVVNVAAKNSSQVAILADRGATVTLTAVTIENTHTALKVGSGGTGSKILIQGSSLRTNTVDFSIQSATGLISASCSIDHEAVTDVITGGVLTGSLFDTEGATTQTRGTAEYVYTTGREINLPEFYHSAMSTGVGQGGAVTAGVGLAVNVSAGMGWISRNAPEDDLHCVTWPAVTGLTLTASATNFVFYDGANLTGIKAATSQPGGSSILLATVVTSGSGVRFIHATPTLAGPTQRIVHDYLVATRKFATNTGLVASQGSGPTKLTVGAGSYYRALKIISYSGSGGDATWSYFYGSNGATEVPNVNVLNTTQYDDAGTLAAMTAGFYRADTLLLTSDGRLSLVYGTSQYPTQGAAEAAGTATVPTFMEDSAICLALVIVQQGVGIATVLDGRPRPGNSSGLGAGGVGITDHGDLSGLLDDDHTQYLLVGGSRAMGDNLDMGGNSIVSVNLVDGVNVSAHGARHNAGAADALTTGTAVAALIGQGNTEGSAAAYSRSDHTHAHGSAAPVAVTKATNEEGTAATFARSDHKHDVSTAAPGSTGVGTASGEGSAATLARSDHTHQSNTAPVAVTRAAAAIGTSGQPARADHKHDVTTAAPAAIGVAAVAGEGAATTLARSDHTHQSNTAPANVTKAVAAIGTSGEPARADHKHDVATAAPGTSGLGTASSEGIATTLARSDHTHQANTAPVAVTKAAAVVGVSGEPARADHKHDVSTAAPAAIGVATAPSEGNETTLARSDHTHQANTVPVNVTKAAAAIGSSGEPARADHKHDVSTAAPGTTALSAASAEGVATTLARSDHTHQSNTAPVAVTRAAAAIGVSGEPARADHKHDVSTAAPAAIGVAATSGQGSATTLARSDHTHQSNTAPVAVTRAAAVIGTSGEPARADHKHDVSTAAPSLGIGVGNTEGTASSLARSDHGHALRETGGPTDLTMGAIADGQIVFRSGSVLMGIGLQDIQGMRLTGVSGTPVMTDNNSSLNTIFLTAYKSNQIALYNGDTWILHSTPEVSLAVTGRTTDLPFDIFAYSAGGVVTLEFTNWAGSTTRATGLVRCDGVWCRSGALTRRYLGTCRPRSSTTYSWVVVGTNEAARFDLWNSDNRVQVAFDLTTTVNSWNYTTATWRQAQGSSAYQVDVVAGLEDCRVVCLLTATSRNNGFAGGNNPREVGVGFDSTTTPIGIIGSSGSTGSIHQISQATATIPCPLGRHFAAWLEISQASSTTTWLGDNGTNRIMSGMQGSWVC
jgi:hypothetical protein